MCWNVEYSLLMMLSTVITYFTGIMIGRSKEQQQKKCWVLISCISNLAILFFFKYTNFMLDSVQYVFDSIELGINMPNFDVLLPVGISFYTFQALSYTFDVYQGNLEPTTHFGKYALFVSFFPQLVAGPIERSKTLLNQFDEVHHFSYEAAKSGFLLILWGTFKKIVIADRLAILVNTVFNDVGSYSGQAYIIASIFFAFQIYCDFSGYSDIAIGSARILGFRLMKNFSRPYLATSIADFWRRWHISLSTWFKDYLYIPLGGSRVSFLCWCRNIMIVFLVSGLWHGASWTFVIWGGLHGFYQVIERLIAKFWHRFIKKAPVGGEVVYGTTINERPLAHQHAIDYKKPAGSNLVRKGFCGNLLTRMLKIVITFVLVDFAWIFFRANSVEDAFTVAGNLFNFMPNFDMYSLGMEKIEFIFSLFMILVLIVADIIEENIKFSELLQRQCLPVRWSAYLVIIFTIILFGMYGNVTEASFIYFQF